MAIPKYFEMYRSFLRALADGGVHPYADVKKQVIADAGLSDEEVAALLPSGNQTIFNNRIGWCRTYLKKAGLIESPTRAHFLITDAGKKVYEADADITNDTLRAFPSFVEFAGGTLSSPDAAPAKESESETPQETLERVHGELNRVLKDELLSRIYQNTPEFFETLVISLMEKMGYGSGRVTQMSRDEGIDGIVYQDKLGFDIIYVQAKRYSPEKTIGRPALQQFSGAIPGNNGRGMFVTTARFSADAIKYAADKHIILIDGERLAQLMIEYDFGVSTEYVYKIKKIDTDLFEEE